MAKVRSTNTERLVGVPATIGARAGAAAPIVLAAATDDDDGIGSACGAAATGTAGAIIAPDADIGGTAITVVRLGCAGSTADDTTGAKPAGTLMVGIPMMVADRGG